ncbi:MAG: hypothetical protein JWQ64_3697 [Subtercola sp.]|jgi:hypothetical protein|nr:hypothetical protein [Subtercola sp.]
MKDTLALSKGRTLTNSHPAVSLRSESSTAPALHELMSPEKNVQRIMWTGTIWFAATVGAVAIVLGLLLSSGWRPALLTGGVRVVWWIGTALVALSIGLIGWSGCPILEVDVPTADHNKTRTMQLGTMLFIIGGAAALLAVMLGPSQ